MLFSSVMSNPSLFSQSHIATSPDCAAHCAALQPKLFSALQSHFATLTSHAHVSNLPCQTAQ